MNKKSIAIFLILLLFAPAVSAQQFSKKFLIEDFEKNPTYNLAGGFKRVSFDGVVREQAPWCVRKNVRDRKRGRVLRVEYDVTVGEAGFATGIYGQKLFPQFDAITFFIKGDANTITVALHGEDVHEYVVGNITNAWQKIIIPYNAFSKQQRFLPQKITEIRFIVSSERAHEREGFFYIDDITLVKTKGVKQQRRVPLPAPGTVFRINGTTPARKVFGEGRLLLDAKYDHGLRKSTLAGVRFEASRDKQYWFYIGEDRLTDDIIFSIAWDAHYFESGRYWVRAVARYKTGEHSAGKGVAITIENDFDALDFLDQVQRKSFQYFLNEYDRETGLIRESSNQNALFSTKACGFALAAFCVGAERNFLTRSDAARRVLRILNTFIEKEPHTFGFYPEHVGMNASGGDVIATAYLVAGALTSKAYFDNPRDDTEKEIRRKADALYHAVRWSRARHTDGGRQILAEKIHTDGTLEGRIEGYRDGMLAYILAITSSSHPLPPSSWKNWAQFYSFASFGEYTVLAFPSLYAHQMPHIWLQLEGMQDDYADYFANTVKITLINREYSLQENDYPSEVWGLSACVGPRGPQAYGAPPPLSNTLNDGTICPSAAGSSITFTPELSTAALYALYKNYGNKIWGVYGFFESINPQEDYYDELYTAVNVGALLLHIENYRSSLVRQLFNKNAQVTRTLKRIGFKQRKSQHTVIK